VVRALEAGAAALRPGALGYKVNAAARRVAADDESEGRGEIPHLEPSMGPQPGGRG
jgi:hypothetical protein